MQRPAARFGAHIFKVETRGVEDQVALYGAEPRGKIRGASGSVFDVHAPVDAGAVQCAFEGSVDLRGAARVQVRDIAAEEAEIQSAIQTQCQGAASGKLDGPRNLEIRVRAAKSDWFDLQRVTR